jgi:pimeloyl-ACP methyl ester carboxylesterase
MAFVVIAMAPTLFGHSACARAAGDGPGAWLDSSPHMLQFVTVEEGVRLEVLDWGGSGRPIVLLAGSGNSAHVFDDLAPKLTDSGHVYGITRRGYGGSSKPESGYSVGRRAQDVLGVLDSLRLAPPVLVGHSLAGDELTTLGSQYPERVAGLVYLDALQDPMDFPSGDPAYMALFAKLPEPMKGPSCARDMTSFAAYRAFFACMDIPLPESELRNTFTAQPDGSVGRSVTPDYVRSAVPAGEVKRDYSKIAAPVLAIFEFPRVGRETRRPDEYQPQSDEERAAIAAFQNATKVFVDRWVASLKRSVPAARLVDLPGAGHYVFLTRETEVLRELRAFVASLPRSSEKRSGE